MAPMRRFHYGDVIMGAIASQITSLTIVYSTVYSDVDQRKHQSSASLAFMWGFPHKWPVTRKMFPFHGVIMCNTDQPTCHTCDPSRPSGWLDDVTKIWASPWESVRPSVLVTFREPLDCRKITNTYIIIRTRHLSKCWWFMIIIHVILGRYQLKYTVGQSRRVIR